MTFIRELGPVARIPAPGWLAAQRPPERAEAPGSIVCDTLGWGRPVGLERSGCHPISDQVVEIDIPACSVTFPQANCRL